MKKSEIKKLIKPLIRECLTEIFMEMKLETIVENVLKEHVKKGPQKKFSNEVLIEDVSPPAVSDVNPEQLKSQMINKLGISEEEWKNMYSDIAESDNPIMMGDDNSKPELVSESALRQAGLFRDYSKFTE